MSNYKQIGVLTLEGKVTVSDNMVFHLKGNGYQSLYLNEQNLRLEGSDIINLSKTNFFFDDHHIDLNLLKEFLNGGKNRIDCMISLGYDFQIIKKVSSWYMYDKTRLASNIRALKQILVDNPDLTNEIEFNIIMRLAKDYCVLNNCYEPQVSDSPFPLYIYYDNHFSGPIEEVKILLEDNPDTYQEIKEKIVKARCIIDDIKTALCSDNATDQLINSLKNDKEEVRKYVAIELGRIGDNKAVGPLIDALTNLEYSSVIKWAAWALGEIGNEQAVEPLIWILEKDYDDFSVRSQAARALGKIKDKRAVEPLIATIDPELIHDYMDELEIEYFNSAIIALGELRDKRALELFKAILDISENVDVIADVTQDVLDNSFKIEY